MRPIKIDPKQRPTHIDPGVAPMLQWVRIDCLVIDDSYQRELKPGNWKAIKRIAARFKWSRFSPVFVAPIEGGKYAIIDGQHRTHAAAMCGFAEVPCQIVHMTAEEQAASFAAVNGMVTKVTVWQVYKAALAAGEDWAVQAAHVASDGGATLMDSNTSSYTKKPGQIYGVTAFRNVIHARKRENIVLALRVLMRAEGYRDASEVWDMGILYPLLMALSERPKALMQPDFVSKFELFDIWSAKDSIDAETKKRLRAGLPYVAKKDQLAAAITDWIDAKFPERVALPAMASA
ncbi:ParB-like nuclease domain-containing protein [Phyllobacterium sp. YR620]|nr:ParB-like nuclease domain-containing protein [Phyllobacterium sp. YR620]